MNCWKKILSDKNILNHNEHDDRNKEWTKNKADIIWNSLNFDIDSLPNNDNFKPFFASLNVTLLQKFKLLILKLMIL